MGSLPKDALPPGNDIISNDDELFEKDNVEAVEASSAHNGLGYANASTQTPTDASNHAALDFNGTNLLHIDRVVGFYSEAKGGLEFDLDDDDNYDPRKRDWCRQNEMENATTVPERRGQVLCQVLLLGHDSEDDGENADADKVNSKPHGKGITAEHCLRGTSNVITSSCTAYDSEVVGASSGKVEGETSSANFHTTMRCVDQYLDMSSSSSSYYDSDYAGLLTGEAYRLWKRQMMDDCVQSVHIGKN